MKGWLPYFPQLRYPASPSRIDLPRLNGENVSSRMRGL